MPSEIFCDKTFLMHYFKRLSSFQTHLLTFFFLARERIWLKGHEHRDKKMAKLQNRCVGSSLRVSKQKKWCPFEGDFTKCLISFDC